MSKPKVDSAIFDIEDYVGGNIEGQEVIDRMGFTVFLRHKLTQSNKQAVLTILKGLLEEGQKIHPTSSRFIEESAILKTIERIERGE